MWIISILVIIAVFVCIVCNFAVNNSMTWMVYPVTSILFGWIVIMPVLYYKKDGVKYSLGLITTFGLLFMLILEQWSGIVGWFIPLAVPIFIASVIYGWILYFLFRKKRNPIYLIAVIIFLSGVLCLTIDLILKASDIYPFPVGWLVFGITTLVSLLIIVTKIILVDNRIRQNNT
ncbi:MAG: DUF6320 domain-containing protein [Methanocorpusculum sp.]|nr:DUF6320 domain-containing protein [Methanocorpusculum sp.]